MIDKIKRIYKLPGSNDQLSWYHVYLEEPTFSSDPIGVLVEEKNGWYTSKPLGFRTQNVFFSTPSLEVSNKKYEEFYEWFKKLSNEEIKNVLTGRKLLKG